MDSNENKPHEHGNSKKYTIGVVVIIAGILLLLSNTGFLPYDLKHIFFSWQMLLIGIGAVSLLNSESRTPGTIMIAIGVVFLIPRAFDLPFNAMQMFWPLILIGIGVLILSKRFPSRRRRHRSDDLPRNEFLVDEGFVKEDNIFSGGKHRIHHQEFRGGQINCIFGGSELDLTQATLAPGTNELEINAIFGGVTLIVPSDWKIVVKMTTILGGFTDKRSYVKENPDPSRILVIRGSTIFGGGEIKSY